MRTDIICWTILVEVGVTYPVKGYVTIKAAIAYNLETGVELAVIYDSVVIHTFNGIDEHELNNIVNSFSPSEFVSDANTPRPILDAYQYGILALDLGGQHWGDDPEMCFQTLKGL